MEKVVAYIDNGHIALASVVLPVCKELGAHPVADFDMIPLYEGHGSEGVGRECRHCGAPLGSIDPDDCKYVMLGVCSDCKE